MVSLIISQVTNMGAGSCQAHPKEGPVSRAGRRVLLFRRDKVRPAGLFFNTVYYEVNPSGEKSRIIRENLVFFRIS